MFVVFEGPEGSGKSTQAKRLAERWRRAGKRVVLTREPGGTQLGERLRSLLLESTPDAVSPAAEALLYSAARAEHVAQVIRPALDARAIVICDRFADSTIAYQGAGRGLDLELLRIVQQFATGGLEPDLRVLLDLPVEIGLRRRHADEASVNRLDRESVAFHQRVRESYLASARRDPKAWLVIDASENVERVAEAISIGVQERTR